MKICEADWCNLGTARPLPGSQWCFAGDLNDMMFQNRSRLCMAMMPFCWDIRTQVGLEQEVLTLMTTTLWRSTMLSAKRRKGKNRRLTFALSWKSWAHQVCQARPFFGMAPISHSH